MSNDTDLIDQVPAAVRRDMGELLAVIGAGLVKASDADRATGRGEPIDDAERKDQSARAQERRVYQAAASELFARHFLPLIVEGEWLEHPPLHLNFEGGDERLRWLLEHVRTFRRVGAQGALHAGNTVTVAQPYPGRLDIADLHGAKTVFGSGGGSLLPTFTLQADCRLADLSWRYPGRTKLVVLAAPELLATRPALPSLNAIETV